MSSDSQWRDEDRDERPAHTIRNLTDAASTGIPDVRPSPHLQSTPSIRQKDEARSCGVPLRSQPWRTFMRGFFLLMT